MWKHLPLAVLLLAVVGSEGRERGCSTEGCSMKFEPMCATSGMMYLNKCFYDAANCHGDLDIDHKGNCFTGGTSPCPENPCPADYNPICGSNGVTYGNLCMLQSANCNNGQGMDHDGECTREDPTAPCPLIKCSAEYSPVCGTDGVTYDNECMLRSANCKNGVTVNHNGECEEVDESECPEVACTKEYDPVCASNGVMYMNKCYYHAANCHGDLETEFCLRLGTTLRPCPLTLCTADYRPVCGTDGVTYANDCMLQSANCNNGVTMDHDGECTTEEASKNECPKTACTMEDDMVCATNGLKFLNKCVFDMANCHDHLKIGQC